MRFPEGQTIRVGDVVYEDGLQRGLWRLGRVERLITGKDRELFSLIKDNTHLFKTTKRV